MNITHETKNKNTNKGMVPEDVRHIFLAWLKIQPRSKTHVRDVLTMKNYEYKPVIELYEIFEEEQKNIKVMNGNIKKTLTLSLKKQWFEMTKSGAKTEDYREITPYWCIRFFEMSWRNSKKQWEIILKTNSTEWLIEMSENINHDYFDFGGYKFKNKFDTNIMTLGYPKSGDTERIIKLEHKGIEIRTGNPEWGAEPDKLYFVIKHGSLVE
ncbi:hypothetical protein JE952_002027 [Flavobacterium psychrophilum]|nr:hypothetical protein [Flavobacterium psychrophilum]